MVKTHRILIPVLVLTVAILGSLFSSAGVSDWYPTLVKPALTPPDWLFGPVWAALYIMAAASAIIFWDHYDQFKMKFWYINALFRLNLLLNLFWSYIFFVDHQVGFALVDIALLDLSTLTLIIMIWPISRLSSLLLMPYFLWTAFATYLNYMILILNP